MGTVAVGVTGARKSYGDASVLSGLDLAVSSGEFLVLLGPSGCGKSTLLSVLAGLESLDAGTVERGGEHVGVVLQQPELMPWLTVRDNVLLGGRYRANRHRFDPRWAEELIPSRTGRARHLLSGPALRRASAAGRGCPRRGDPPGPAAARRTLQRPGPGCAR